MNTRRNVVALALLLASLSILPVARADQSDQASKLTFNQAVQIPGRVLPAGTYWFVLADQGAHHNIVEIFNEDRSKPYTIIQTIDTERARPSGHTVLTFAERDPMPSNAILTWFYPGFGTGHEFVYSKAERQELAGARRETIMATAQGKNQIVTTGD